VSGGISPRGAISVMAPRPGTVQVDKEVRNLGASRGKHSSTSNPEFKTSTQVGHRIPVAKFANLARQLHKFLCSNVLTRDNTLEGGENGRYTRKPLFEITFRLRCSSPIVRPALAPVVSAQYRCGCVPQTLSAGARLCSTTSCQSEHCWPVRYRYVCGMLQCMTASIMVQ